MDPWKLGFSGRCSRNASWLTRSHWSASVLSLITSVIPDVLASTIACGQISEQDTDCVCRLHCNVSGAPGKEQFIHLWAFSFWVLSSGSLELQLCPLAKVRASVLLPKWSSTWEATITNGRLPSRFGHLGSAHIPQGTSYPWLWVGPEEEFPILRQHNPRCRKCIQLLFEDYHFFSCCHICSLASVSEIAFNLESK